MVCCVRWDKLAKLDNWVKKRYFILVKKFGKKPFRLEDADRALEEEGIEAKNTKELLSVLRKEGLLKVEKDPQDFRRSIYKLVLENEEKVTRDKLFRILKAGADLIRTSVDYKVLLLFLFYKAISDKWNAIVHKYIEGGFSKVEAYLLANRDFFVLYDEEEEKLYTWQEITKSRDTIRKIANALITIAKLNPDRLSRLPKLITQLGLMEYIREDITHILENLVTLFSSIDLSEVDMDVLGDAYQWILHNFAPQRGKEGEVFTPPEVIRLLVRLLDIEDGSSVLDPALGSAAMLIEAYKYVKEKNIESGKDDPEPRLQLMGQERNDVIATIAELNLALHGIEAKVYVGDSLTNPQFDEADYVLANPPWNQKGYDEKVLGKDPTIRKIYTKYSTRGFPPRNHADWAWIQLMLYFAKKKVGIILDSGVLFREGKEKTIRRDIVEKDLIEAIILLPTKLFYNTSAPGVIIIFNKSKSPERKEKILFINASNEYEQHPSIKRLNILATNNIEKILDAYRNFKNIDGFSRVVEIKEIRENDYDLNITQYVIPRSIEEHIDISAEFHKLEQIEERLQDINKELKSYITQIIRAIGET